MFPLILFFCLLFKISLCARILVSSMDVTPSQTLLLAGVADILVENDHDVTFFHSIMVQGGPQLKPKLAKEISFVLFENNEYMNDLAEAENMIWDQDESPGLIGAPFKLYYSILTHFADGCERRISNKGLMNELKEANFDIMIIHHDDLCMFGVAELIGVKTTAYFCTFFMIEPLPWYTGTPAPASYVPSTVMVETDQMDFFARMYNLASVSANYAFQFLFTRMLTQRFRKHFGQNFPHLDDLIKEVQLTFINSDPFFEYPRPTLHNVIYVGGMTMQKPKPLNSEWGKIVDESLPNGIVLFSLGTLVDTKNMPLKIKVALLGAFSRFPKHTFICRLEGEIPKKPPNVKIVKWIPQKDILHEPKLKLFITHGGQKSLTEATYVGVPMLAMPMFYDQKGNTKRMERLEVGKTIEKSALTDENKIYKAIIDVLGNETYRNNAKRLAKMIQNKPVSSLDLFLKWINFLAEFRNLDSLKPESRNMGISQYFMIDVLAFLFTILLIFIWLMIRCCKRFCFRSNIKEESKKE